MKIMRRYIQPYYALYNLIYNYNYIRQSYKPDIENLDIIILENW